MGKLGKKNSYERGTVMAYSCATCYCYCSTCTNCTGSTLQYNGSSILYTVTDNKNENAYNLPYLL